MYQNERIILGTANFGRLYGVTADKDTASHRNITNILDIAHKYGVRTLDTSPNYGDSDDFVICCGKNQFSVGTKITGLEKCKGSKAAIAVVSELLTRYNQSNLDYLLVHNTSDLNLEKIKNIGFLAPILKQKFKGMKFGISVYSPMEIENVYNVFKPDIVQIPVNVFDSRLEHSSILNQLLDDRVEVHARSIFLQGLLSNARSKSINKIRENNQNIFEEWGNYCASQRLDPETLALLHVLGKKWITKIVIGVNNGFQLQKNMQVIETANFHWRGPEFNIKASETLIDPRKWQE